MLLTGVVETVPLINIVVALGIFSATIVLTARISTKSQDWTQRPLF